MSLRHRFLLWFLLGSLLPVVFTGVVAYQQARESLLAGLFDQMRALTDDRVRELQHWQISQADHVEVLAGNPAIQQCKTRLGEAMRQSGPLSAAYRVVRAACSQALDLDSLEGVDDILLVDVDGRVVYSAKGRRDFGSELFQGELGRTMLADNVRQALRQPGMYFVPYDFYSPSGSETAFWLATMVEQGKVSGFFIISISDASLNTILVSRTGLGQSGEVMLARKEPDGKALVMGPLRHHPDAAFHLRIKRRTSEPQSIFDALQGQRGAGLRRDYRGEPVLAAWAPVPGLGWAVEVKIDQQEALEPLRQLQWQVLQVLLLVALVISALAYWASQRLLKPLQALVQASVSLGEGDIHSRIQNPGTDEIGVLGHSFNSMAEQLAQSQKRLWNYAFELEAKVAEHTATLLQRQQQLEDAEQMARLGYYIVDLQTGEVSWSRQLSSLLDYPEQFDASEVLFLARIHPEDQARVLAAYQQAQTGQYHLNYRLQLAGELKYVQEQGRYDFSEDGEPLRRMAVIQDISHYVAILEEKTATLQALEQERLARAEQAVGHAEAKAQAILHAIDDGIIGLSMEGMVVFSNPAAASMLGLVVATLTGRALDDVLLHHNPEGEPFGTPGPLAQALALGQPCASQWELFGSAQREAFPVSYELHLLPEGHGNLAAVLYFRDISAQRASEAKLEQMSRAVTQSPAGVLITDTQGVIEYVNPRLIAMTGYSEQEILGQTPQLFKSGLTSEQTYQDLWHTLRQGNSWHGEMLNRRKDGRELWLMQMISPLRDSAGRLTHFISIQEDIGDQKALVQQMEAARLAAEAAAATKSAFLANMSHEIRTPMNAIIGMADLALRDTLPERTRQFLQKLLGSARGLLDIINDILDFSKIESGHLQVEQVPFDLEDVLGSLADMLAMRLEGKPVELVFDIAPAVPPVLVGDSLRLGQVLLNLLGNAVKFTREGEIILRIYPQDGGWHFSVSDSGIGMSDAQQQGLFQPFSQADVSTQRRYGGTGLGLVISSQLVRLMGGECIDVVSQPGVGSTFSFTLPLAAGGGQKLAGPLAVNRVYLYGVRPTLTAVLQQQFAAMGLPVQPFTGVGATVCALGEQRAGDVWLVDIDQPGWSHVFNEVRWQPGVWCVLLSVRHLGMAEVTPFMPATMPVAAIWVKPLTPQRLRHGLKQLGRKPAQAQQVAPEVHEQCLAGRQVLVVDDVLLNQEVVAAYLMDAGAQVSYAGNGEEALHRLASEKPDVILMDCHMPVMDGFAATARIRAHPLWRSIPIVALTANALSGSREEAIAAGMDDYISKPIDPDKLFAVLARLGISQPPAAGQVATQPPAAIVAGEAAAQMPEHDAWQALQHAGVQLEEGLARAMGKRKVYLKWLRLFAQSQESFPQDAAQALAQQDWVLLQRLAHTLKGAASNVSAEAVRERAEQLENSVRDQQGEAALAGQLAALVPVFEACRQAIVHLPDSE
ncbi:MAG: PAS domain-containing protein [Vogesella sp.]|nr:PAS domain-containing protein [Vogesella sp.]